ncbi:MAG: DNA primase [Erysipelotrichaceae bacterium]|nr:DNA primase [Erysipelotrichaceae bacterium]
MAKMSQEKIDEIRQSVDIVDVIGQYLALHKAGRNYKAVCPFHNDTNPSLMISQQKQIYHCFVCGNGGNAFTFLQRFNNISFMEAVEQVAEMGNVDISDYVIPHQQVAKVAEGVKVYYDMHEEAAKLYSYYLNTRAGTLAMDYLRGRGFDQDTLTKFDIGYAPPKPVLYNAFSKLDYKEVDMVKSGLVIESERHYDRFSDRIMFPLHDDRGRVVGFSGRIYRPGDDGAKYVNSPESEIFIKGRTLYNYHRALDSAKREGFVYINEGFMDVIAMSRAGHDNAIALMGTALTSGHMQLLNRMCKRVVLCLDGDEAGQNAAIKAAEILQENQFKVEMILLPEGRDPDEILTSEGRGGLDEILRHLIKPLDFMLEHETMRLNMNDYEDRKSLLIKGCAAISRLTDKIDRAAYIEELAKRTHFSEAIVREQLSEAAKRQVVKDEYPVSPVEQVRQTQAVMNKYDRAERSLLFYMLNDRAVARRYEVEAGFMYNDTYRILASYIVDYYHHHQEMNEADLINRIGDHQGNLISTLAAVADSHLPLPYSDKAIDDYIKIISENALRLKKEQLRDQFNHIIDPQVKSEILKQIIALEKENI